MDFIVKTETGAYDLHAAVRMIGADVLVAVWGGQQPHIGAVAVAQPRPSLKDSTRMSATASVFCFPGHKEDELAKATATTLAAKLNTRTVVTAGIHWNNLDAEGIRTVNANSRQLTALIIQRVSFE
ncbi:MAG: hypothetical protein RBT11_02375 [Desulfobacterales bacterium]|jgi:hypothetical protein|nr:hypothetical protein [Desulfobacterales bacterium]